ncbi:MAG: VF_A0006 family four-cysteine protein [Pseudomonas sp.]|uniref:VF_A0006 family four-cysteine protein n=1 Tax=Pseudomonas sp. TaxID=306 RepID=UPI0033935F3B
MVIRFSAVLLMMASTVCAAFDAETEDYQDCVLTHQKGAKTERSAFYIQQSCRKYFLEGNYLFTAEKRYHRCIIDKMPGVETEAATSQVLSICNEKSQD